LHTSSAADHARDGTGQRIRLVLVRHGESEWNAANIIQGHLGPGLSALGKDQADAVSAELRHRFGDASLIVCSDLERVTETAQPYRQESNLPVIVDPRWREIDNGAWSGKTHAQVAQEFPEEFAAARRREDIPRGGGETFAQLRERVAGAVHDRVAAERSPEPVVTVVVFTHGGPIRVATADALGLPVPGHWQLQPPENCSITVIDHPVSQQDTHPNPVVVAYNETSHLPGVGHASATDDVAAAEPAATPG